MTQLGQLRGGGLLLMPEHTGDGCAWCSALNRRNALLRNRKLLAAALLTLLALIGWEVTH